MNFSEQIKDFSSHQASRMIVELREIELTVSPRPALMDRGETWDINLPTCFCYPETAGEVLHWYLGLSLTSKNLVGLRDNRD